MIESDVFVQALENLGVNFFTGVPDSLLGGIIEELLTRKLYTPGTSLNTLISLNMMYRQPCILLVSWRGFEGKDAPEHLVMGETMPQLLDTMRIPHRTLSEPTMMDDLRWVGQTVMKQRVPVALLIKKGIIKGLHP